MASTILAWMRHLRFSCCVFLLLLWTAPAAAVEFNPLGTTRGLDAQVAADVLLDRRGVLWVASREGLFRYDGYQARRFMPDDAQPDSISDSDLRVLFEDRAGDLWIGTNTGGLNRLDSSSGEFTTYRREEGNPQSLSYDSVYDIVQRADGQFWVATQIGLNLLDPATGRVQRFLHDPDNPASLPNNYVHDLHLDPQGGLWVATIGGGISRWQPDTGGFRNYDLARLTGLEESVNDTFSIANVGQMLFITTRDGLIRLQPDSEQAERIDVGTLEGEHPTLTTLEKDAENRLWLASLDRGIIVHDPSAGSWWPASADPLDSPGQLPSVPALTLAFFNDLLFVGTWGDGVYLARINHPDFELLDSADPDSGLRYDNISALTVGADGTTWIGTFGDGIQPLSDNHDRALPPPGKEDASWKAGALDFAETRTGELLVASSEGVWRIEPATGQWTLYEHSANAPGTIGAGYVVSIGPAADGGFWVGTGGSGLYHFDLLKESFRRVLATADVKPDTATAGTGIPADFINTVLQDGPDSLWVGSRSNGLYRCSLVSQRCESWSSQTDSDQATDNGLGHYHVSTLYRDSGDRLWVGTDGGGLHQVEQDATGRITGFRRWTRSDGLVADSIMGLVEDDDGSLWISTREGLSRLQPASGQIVNYNRWTNLPLVNFNAKSAARDGDWLYFGGLGGLVKIPAGTDFESRAPAPVLISELAPLSETRSPRTQSAVTAPDQFNHGDVISTEFVVLDYSEIPHDYRYRLDGSDWQNLGNRNELTFFGLTPGEHLLEIKGRDVYGQWSQAEPAGFSVIPPFWMTWWFRLLALIMLIALIVLIHQWRTRSLRRRNLELERLQRQREKALTEARRSQRELEDAYRGLRQLTTRLESAKEEERRRISRELHDELGQTLTAAKINLQRLTRLQGDGAADQPLADTIGMLDNMINQVRNVSLTLRPPLLDEAGLVPALEYYCDSLTKRTGLEIRLDADAALQTSNGHLDTLTFRIIQEALSNILRHANASQANIRLEQLEGELLVSIRDNGQGFDPVAVQAEINRGEHLGLLGMRERVDAAGGQFELDAEPGQGARITARLPLNRVISESAA